MDKVELNQAFMWDCPTCGVENFCRAIKYEGDPAEQEEMIRAALGLEDWEKITDDDIGSEFLIAPDEVKCHSCGIVFETTDSMNFDDEEEE